MSRATREIAFRFGDTRYHYTSIQAAVDDAARLARREEELIRQSQEVFSLRCQLDRQIAAARAADAAENL